MTRKSSNPYDYRSRSQKPNGFKGGCLALLALPAIIYFFHAIFLIAPNMVNHVKWRLRGSTNYSYSVMKSGLLPPSIMGERRVSVEGGEVVQVTNVYLAKPGYAADIETIEEMFNGVYICSLFFPLTRCSYQYDSFYGYPSEMIADCPIPDACYTGTFIEDVKILPP
jgi:hypothetical protein